MDKGKTIWHHIDMEATHMKRYLIAIVILALLALSFLGYSTGIAVPVFAQGLPPVSEPGPRTGGPIYPDPGPPAPRWPTN